LTKKKAVRPFGLGYSNRFSPYQLTPEGNLARAIRLIEDVNVCPRSDQALGVDLGQPGDFNPDVALPRLNT